MAPASCLLQPNAEGGRAARDRRHADGKPLKIARAPERSYDVDMEVLRNLEEGDLERFPRRPKGKRMDLRRADEVEP